MSQIGTSAACIIEGSRSFIVEVQCLATAQIMARLSGLLWESSRKKLAILLAILEKNLALYLRNNDVFIISQAGIRTADTSLDLAILAAIISSLKDSPLPETRCSSAKWGPEWRSGVLSRSLNHAYQKPRN